MKRSLVMLMIAAVACVYMPGCGSSVNVTRTQTTAQAVEPFDESNTFSNRAKKPAASPIRGEWSEPVNGLRMAVKQVRTNTASDHLTLLILIENVTDKSVAWHGIRPEFAVIQGGIEDGQLRQQDRQQETPCRTGENLRIAIEPVFGGLRSAWDIHERLTEQLQEMHASLKPGEIRLHAIELRKPEARLQVAQQQRTWDTIEADTVYWPGINDAGDNRPYRITLTYRPDGAFPGKHTSEALERLDTQDWKGKQIDIPPIVVRWYRMSGGGSEQIKEF